MKKMKKSLTDYAASLSGSNIEILEEIIAKKYRKFVKFFNLMKDYTDDISKIEYEFSDDATLSIKIEFSKSVKLDDKKELIAGWKKSGYDIDYKISGKKMKLVIIYPE